MTEPGHYRFTVDFIFGRGPEVGEKEKEGALYCRCRGSLSRYISSYYEVHAKGVEIGGVILAVHCLIFIYC